MKLVEILAKVLEDWPQEVVSFFQWGSGCIYATSKGVPTEYKHGVWEVAGEHIVMAYDAPRYGKKHRLATDHATAIVTRADWEAERAKLKAHKANGGGWVRHRGGKCPVEAGVQVECKLRNGNSIVGRASCIEWSHTGAKMNGEVMRYRIHKPAEQTCLVEARAAERLATLDPAKAVSLEEMEQRFAGPLEWRDRIRELDAQRAEVESTHQRQISKITQERESLVQQLAGEGLALAEVVVQPVEDMSDWAKWREGDIIEFIKTDGDTPYFTLGKHYVVADVNMRSCNPVSVKEDDDGDYNGWKGEYFKFVSRPAS